MVNIKINSDGNLEITATENGKPYINEHLETDSIMFIWLGLLESNDTYNVVEPKNIGYLMGSPVIADIPPVISDNGIVTYDDETNFYYFRDYMITNELRQLSNGETVTFSFID